MESTAWGDAAPGGWTCAAVQAVRQPGTTMEKMRESMGDDRGWLEGLGVRSECGK